MSEVYIKEGAVYKCTATYGCDEVILRAVRDINRHEPITNNQIVKTDHCYLEYNEIVVCPRCERINPIHEVCNHRLWHEVDSRQDCSL